MSAAEAVQSSMPDGMLPVDTVVTVKSVDSLRRIREWAGPKGFWPLIGCTGVVVACFADGYHLVDITVGRGRNQHVVTHPLMTEDLEVVVTA